LTDVIAPGEADQHDEVEQIGSPATTTSTPSQSGRTRISAAWGGVMVGALVLVLVLVFILQNTRSVKVSYFTLAGSMPLGIALLLATIGGLLLAGGIASLRIWQLRRRLIRQTKSSRLVMGSGASSPGD
jgi:uncharacterized integral membrane protein